MIFRRLLYGFLIAAAGLALASCSDKLALVTDAQTAPDAQNSPDGSRVITVSFGADTKVAINGLQPSFEATDEILVSDGTHTETCRVQISGGKASISTDLTGPLKAVFPATAAALDGNAITGVNIPPVQTGLLKDAIFATADIYDNSGLFTCQSSILSFYVDASIGVKSLTVTTSNIADIATGSSTVKVDPGTPDDDTLISSVTTGNADSRLCYVAVRKDTYAGDLTFTSNTTTQGTVTRRSPSTAILLPGNIYNSFIPYYITMGTQKWGYCNVGAFLPEDAGKYFAWGDTEGRYAATSGAGAFAAKPFNWANAPFNGGAADYDSEYFDTLKSTVCPSNVLALQYDAAYVNWGPGWRMPNGATDASGDFVILAKACGKTPTATCTITPTSTSASPTAKGVYRYNLTGVQGIYFVDADKHKLFFPAAGRGMDTSIDTTECPPVTYGFYWSSTLGSSADNAERMDFNTVTVSLSYPNFRSYGYCVRPVFIDHEDTEGLDIHQYDPFITIE